MNSRVRVQPKEEQQQPLHIKYRPTELCEVVGQKHVKASLEKILDSRSMPHSFLFTGPSGTGKTTIARIIASHLDVSVGNLIEVDAATNNGIDDMRQVTDVLRYQGFGETPRKLIIIDECHALSKAAWQSLLKSVEEPPPHVYWVFCTTDAGKVPETVRTRCAAYDLKPVKHDDLFDLLDFVAGKEDLKVSDRTLHLIADAAGGSPRQSLVYLAAVDGVDDEDKIAMLLSEPGENPEIIDLCRDLVKGKLDWPRLTDTLKKIEMPAESIRIVISAYLSSCLLGAKTDRQVEDLLMMLSQFSKPFNASDKLAPLLLAFGDLLYPPR